MLGLLGLISPLVSAIGSIFVSFANKDIAVVKAQAQVETAAIESTASVEQRWWFVSAMIPAFSLPFAIYYGKLLVWDKVLGFGTTDPLSGNLNYIGMIIISGLFLHSMVSK